MLPVWLTDTLTSDLDRALGYTLQWGLEGVVLRTVGRGSRVPEVNEEKLRRRLAEAELPAVAVDPGLLEGSPGERAVWLNDLERLGEVAAFCKRIDCPRIIVGALGGGTSEGAADPLHRAADVAARSGLTLVVRNEGGGRETGTDLSAVLELTPPALQACWDPVHAFQAGEPAEDGLNALGGRIGMVMVRDGVPLGDGWERRQVGEGAVGWPGVLTALHAAGFDGPLCLDMGGLTPKEALREATALIYLLRDARRS